MIEGPTRQVVIGNGLFLLCGLVLLSLRILPLSGGFTGWPGPDVGLCLLFAWLLRRRSIGRPGHRWHVPAGGCVTAAPSGAVDSYRSGGKRGRTLS